MYRIWWAKPLMKSLRSRQLAIPCSTLSLCALCDHRGGDWVSPRERACFFMLLASCFFLTAAFAARVWRCCSFLECWHKGCSGRVLGAADALSHDLLMICHLTKICPQCYLGCVVSILGVMTFTFLRWVTSACMRGSPALGLCIVALNFAK